MHHDQNTVWQVLHAQTLVAHGSLNRGGRTKPVPILLKCSNGLPSAVHHIPWFVQQISIEATTGNACHSTAGHDASKHGWHLLAELYKALRAKVASNGITAADYLQTGEFRLQLATCVSIIVAGPSGGEVAGRSSGCGSLQDRRMLSAPMLTTCSQCA